MSDHSKPRRWTLDWQMGPARVTGPKELGGDKSVAVREDCITETDVEAVAMWLFGYENATSDHTWETIEDPGRDLWRHNARFILAHIFEGGEQ